MNITLTKKVNSTLTSLALLFILGTITISCQDNDAAQQKEMSTGNATTEATPVVAKRPAPEFFVVPEDLANKRVWICDNETADVFHLKHDCPILIQCKGKGTFRNMTLPRAVEDYGRYNCQECAKGLDHVYDEDAVRMETGLGIKPTN